MIYSKLLRQYGRRQHKEILEKAIYLGEKSKKNQFLTNLGCRIQKNGFQSDIFSINELILIFFFNKRPKFASPMANVSRFINF